MSARNGLAVPPLPQVNLLPPEVRSARSLGRVKQWLGVSLVLTLLVIGGAFAYTVLEDGQAQAELQVAQEQTVTLLAEQQKYAEVPVVLDQLDRTRAARELGMSTEILWADYLGAIQAVAPQEITIETLNYTGASPMTQPSIPANVLVAPGVGTLTFTGRADTVPDTAAWIDALETVPGFADAWVTVAQIDGDEDATYYTVSSSVQVHLEAYAERFVASTPEPAADEVEAATVADTDGED